MSDLIANEMLDNLRHNVAEQKERQQPKTVSQERSGSLQLHGNAELLCMTHGQNSIFLDHKTAGWLIGMLTDWNAMHTEKYGDAQ